MRKKTEKRERKRKSWRHPFWAEEKSGREVRASWIKGSHSDLLMPWDITPLAEKVESEGKMEYTHHWQGKYRAGKMGVHHW